MSEIIYLTQELTEAKHYLQTVKHSTNKKLFTEAQEEVTLIESLINSLK